MAWSEARLDWDGYRPGYYVAILYTVCGVSCLDMGDHVVLVVPQTRLSFSCTAADLGL